MSRRESSAETSTGRASTWVPLARRWATVLDTLRAAVAPVALLTLLTAFLLTLSGASARVDDLIWGEVRARLAGARSEAPPTVFGLDAATFDAEGPLPWGTATWAKLGQAFALQGVQTVQLGERWDRLIRPDGGALGPVTWLAPRVAPDGTASPPPPAELASGLRLENVALRLPRSPIVQDIAPTVTVEGSAGDEDVPHIACAPPATCLPDHRVPLSGRAVGVVGTSVALRAQAGFIAVNPGATPLIGVIDPRSASFRWTYGRSEPRAEVELLADAVASGRAGAISRPIRGLGAILWLAALHVAVIALARRDDPARWLVLGPVVGFAGAVLVRFGIGLEAPLLSATIAAAGAPVASMAQRTASASAELHRLELLILRAASRAGLLRRRLLEEADVAAALREATALHAPGCTAFLMRPARIVGLVDGWRTVEFEGFLTASALDPALRAGRHADLRAVLATRRPAVAEGLLSIPTRPTLLLPLFQGNQVVGVWGVVPPAGQAPPDGRALGVVAAAIGDRIALGVQIGGLGQLERMTDDESETLFVAVDDERRRWMIIFRGLLHPAMAADTTGLTTLANPAMQRALSAARLPPCRSLHDLVLHVAPPELGRPMLDSLFADAKPIVLPWPDVGDGSRTLVVRSVGGRTEGEPGPPLGWLATVEAGAHVHEASLPELDEATSDVREHRFDPPSTLAPVHHDEPGQV